MNIFELTHSDLTKKLKQKYDKGKYHSTALYREIIQKGNLEYKDAEEFKKSGKLAAKIKSDIIIPVPKVINSISKDNTLKFLCHYSDNLKSESVIIPMKNHNTLCISSQIGCKMGCAFCETGKMGFTRNLTVSEIVSQVYCARFILKQKIKNIVFMGMGEPFDNFNNVIKSIKVLNDQRGFDFAHRHITISTVGLIDGIKKLESLQWDKINLAISLNAPNNTIRSSLMPINKKYSMTDLKKVLSEYRLRKKGLFFIEYVLIRGINNSKKNAYEIAEYLKGIKVRINLIPLNETSSFPVKGTTDNEINSFADHLEKKGIPVVKRWSRGNSLFAACGQLGNNSIRN